MGCSSRERAGCPRINALDMRILNSRYVDVQIHLIAHGDLFSFGLDTSPGGGGGAPAQHRHVPATMHACLASSYLPDDGSPPKLAISHP